MVNENIKIEDGFLDQEEFDHIQEMMMGEKFPWFFKCGYYAKVPSTLLDKFELDQFQFTHAFYERRASQDSFLPSWSSGMEQLEGLIIKLQAVLVVRTRGNLLTRLPIIIENAFHSDMEDLPEEKSKQLTTSIFYINTNNGYTKFEDGTKVESVANRMLTFPANMKHTGTTCSDEKIRVVINFNYFN